ncbi:hypothetical protein GTY65_16250 [Streptomyces sp. SID8379]|uniref:hypothetical protein n=1 Tax=unclassified Streptomyces TaxID=2593676 RepID=UPI0003738306|nr:MULTISPECIES: hypothetical protein [unclassified Streptomyces]MYW65597.1 hypothetical protein [Streptomyces sp. SID8379]
MSYVPALPDVTRYTWWGDVPEGLFTKTDLARQGFKPGSEPVGQVLYHGNSYAPLYEADRALPKRACSPAQRAVLDRARSLRRECRRCGVRRDYPLGRGRWCEPCACSVAAFAIHDGAQQHARQALAEDGTVLLVVADDPDAPGATGPATVAVVGLQDGHLLYAAEAGQHSSTQRADVVDQLDTLLAGRRVLTESDRDEGHRIASRLLDNGERPRPAGTTDAHPWVWGGGTVATFWREWFAWTDHPGSYYPSMPWRAGIDLPWPRTAAADHDARHLATLVQQIADGSSPVWPGALWMADQKGQPDLSLPHVRAAAERMVAV